MKFLFRLIAILSISLCVYTISLAGQLKVYWVDVEGGAATLIITPARESVLIDTGLPGERDPGRINRLAREEAGISKIDHLVITHFDRDHYGGAADLSRLIPIGTVYDHGFRPQDRERVGEDYIKFECEARLVLTPGDKLPLKQTDDGPALEMTTLGVLQRTIEATSEHARNPLPSGYTRQDPDLSHNANSIILLIKFGEWEFLDAADLSWNLEEKLVSPYNLVGEIDVYQVDHHGLDRSNNTHFIHSLKPAVAVMNNGHRKGTGPITVAGLRSSPGIQAIYQVHKCLRDGEGHLNTEIEKIANLEASGNCDGNFLFLTVEEDGESYQVTVPRSGHMGTYQTR
jgi:hypothetical protein